MKYINDSNVIIKSWCNEPELGAIEQAKKLADMPFMFKQVCLMPDTHQGYGMPIGGVIATKNVVIPNAVGVDIGCGMCAVKTNLSNISTDRLKEIMTLIRKWIPVGFKRHTKPQNDKYMPYYESTDLDHDLSNLQLYPVAGRDKTQYTSIGTLGGGNHFIEIQKGSDGHIWFMLHSGSRNLGKQICDHYNKIAIDLNKKYFNYTKDLAFLPLDTKEGQDYLREMNYALEFAKSNRNLMVERVKKAFTAKICNTCNGNGGKKGVKCPHCSGGVLDNESYNVGFCETINIHHNYAAMEHHFGKNVMVHRKGATRAYTDELGIIPGSQGTSSYIVKGKGNPESFKSCSHGAGRKMSRKKAQKNLNLKEEQDKLNNLGVLHSIRGTKDLDEASSAYKDIDIVMEEQKDLVDILIKLTPLGVIKG